MVKQLSWLLRCASTMSTTLSACVRLQLSRSWWEKMGQGFLYCKQEFYFVVVSKPVCCTVCAHGEGEGGPGWAGQKVLPLFECLSLGEPWGHRLLEEHGGDGQQAEPWLLKNITSCWHTTCNKTWAMFQWHQLTAFLTHVQNKYCTVRSLFLASFCSFWQTR